MRNFETVLEEIRSCGSSADNEKLPSLFAELEVASLEYDTWPDSVFKKILELQLDPGYRALDNSWTLLYFLSNSWGTLTLQQREDLRSVLIQGFDGYQNWMGAFVTSELLGERYADEAALAALASLGTSARLPARAAAPHGVEVLARATLSESLRGLAIDRLRQLAESGSEQVKEEALVSLRKLGH